MKPTFVVILAIASQVTAHGFVKAFVAEDVNYEGYDPSFRWRNPVPIVAGWSDPQNNDNGFINDYSSPDLICHRGATPGKAYAVVHAGGSIQVEWTPWPDTHKGPLIDYLAACDGDCTEVNKTTLLWNKISEQGLLDGSSVPGKYAADALVQAGNKWTVKIPASIAPGNYVLRQEIIALQEANRLKGAQNYPQCINVKITGSGTNTLVGVGTPYDKLYNSTDPGILFDIWQKQTSYPIPGPALFNASSGPSPSTSMAPASSAAPNTKPSPPSSTPGPNNPPKVSTATTVVASKSTMAGGETGTFIQSSTGRAKKFVCYEEL